MTETIGQFPQKLLNISQEKKQQQNNLMSFISNDFRSGVNKQQIGCDQPTTTTTTIQG